MQVKKAGGKVFGANLTAAEKKALDMEMKRYFAEYDRKNIQEVDAVVLWVLHEQFGFGPERLKRFFDNFNSSIKDLLARYEMDNSEDVWMCTYKLKEIGVDIEKWYKEDSTISCSNSAKLR